MPNVSKTVGPQTAKLLATLYDRAQTLFRLNDVEVITHLPPASARSLMRQAERRGLVTRLQPGLFAIIPAELGSATEYAPDPYRTARALVGDADYYLSHASALELHRMVTQPQYTVFVSTPKRLAARVVHGVEYRFVTVRPKDLFGTTRHWVTKQEAVVVSDRERTVIDGLRQPEYCGGVTEVAKGLWMRRADFDADRAAGYALRLGIGAVVRRLGYLLELYELGSEPTIGRLREALTATYVPLDPVLPREGPHVARWRLQLNIVPEELSAVRST